MFKDKNNRKGIRNILISDCINKNLESGMRVKAFINDQSLRSSFLQEIFLSRIMATYARGHVTTNKIACYKC